MGLISDKPDGHVLLVKVGLLKAGAARVYLGWLKITKVCQSQNGIEAAEPVAK